MMKNNDCGFDFDEFYHFISSLKSGTEAVFRLLAAVEKLGEVCSWSNIEGVDLSLLIDDWEMATMSVKMLGKSPVSMLTTCSLQLLRFASRSLGDGRNTSSTSPEMMKIKRMRMMSTLPTLPFIENLTSFVIR